MSLNAFVNSLGEAVYYKNLMEADLDNFLVLWEDKRFKRRLYGPSHPNAGNPKEDQKMRARIADLKQRMDVFFRPETCENPWPADSSKVMTSWFSNLDYHPCVVADNLKTGIDIWLHNYGCQGEKNLFLIEYCNFQTRLLK